MPIQIFCTISFTPNQEKNTIKDAAESNGGDKFLYSRHEVEDLEVDYEDGAELQEKEEVAPDLITFANSCTLHGANHIFVESGFGVRQALWTGAFLFSLSIFLYQVVGRIFYYLEYHHITQLDEQESSQMTFPAVTFCNFNRIRVSQLTYSDLIYISPLVGYDEIPFEAGFPLVPPAFEIPDEPLNLYTFFDRNSHQLEDMLLGCRYRGKPCRPDDFSVVSGSCGSPSASFSQGRHVAQTQNTCALYAASLRFSLWA